MIFLPTFTAGDSVRTTQEYFNRTGRIVYGTLVELRCDVPDIYEAMVWEKQEGKVDHRMSGLKVLMKRDELELHN